MGIVNQKIGTGDTVDLAKLQGEDQFRFDVFIDEASAAITYYGICSPGIASNVAKWRILRKQIVGNVTKYRYANSSSDFNQIWDNRASLTYAD